MKNSASFQTEITRLRGDSPKSIFLFNYSKSLIDCLAYFLLCNTKYTDIFKLMSLFLKLKLMCTDCNQTLSPKYFQSNTDSDT